LLNGHSFESPAQTFIASSSSKQQQAAAASSKQQQQKFTASSSSSKMSQHTKCPHVQQAKVYIFKSGYTSTVTDMS
jgi:flavin reductase (DIM6/NTAB) family NADH-FMN oxidoreductase RutF